MNTRTTIIVLAVVPFLMMPYGCDDGSSYSSASGIDSDPLRPSSASGSYQGQRQPSTTIKLYQAEFQGLQAGRDDQGKYSPYVARLVGRVYHNASPLFDESNVRAFVRQNRAIFARDGAFVGCANTLGAVLVRQAIGSFGQNDYDQAYGSALGMGATGEQARKVADSMQSGSLDMFRMGQELQWLAQVLPAAAAGNWTPFNTTGTYLRTEYRKVKPLMDEMSDADVRAIIRQVGGQFEPIVEDQIMWLAIMTGICRNSP